MSCDLLEHAKEVYKVENGTVPPELPQIPNEIVVQPKIIQNPPVEQVLHTYTNVSIELDLYDWSNAGESLNAIYSIHLGTN